jgi:hypothetical protein
MVQEVLAKLFPNKSERLLIPLGFESRGQVKVEIGEIGAWAVSLEKCLHSIPRYWLVLDEIFILIVAE